MFFLPSHAASLADFKTYFATEASINGHCERKGMLAPTSNYKTTVAFPHHFNHMLLMPNSAACFIISALNERVIR